MEVTSTHLSGRVEAYESKKKFVLKAHQSDNILKRHRFLVAWIGFHAMAWLLSILQWPFFNNTGEPQIEKFWPLVKFTEKRFTMVQKQPVEIWDTTTNFNGIFTQYDWTEFLTYVGLVLFGMLLAFVNRKTS
jgi:hypothetical protein